MKILRKTTLVLPREDRIRAERLLKQVGDIIARNNDRGLELDFEKWVQAHFGVSDDTEEPAFNTEGLLLC